MRISVMTLLKTLKQFSIPSTLFLVLSFVYVSDILISGSIFS